VSRVPRSALVLGLAGLVPFVWGALTLLFQPLAVAGQAWLGPRFIGPYVQLSYGTVILAFMSGVLWGFATKTTDGRAATGYVLSVIPALWAFFMVGGGPVSAGMNLIFGYIGLLILDAQFVRWGLAPDWWMPLRGLLTAVVLACLCVGVIL
jgi:hypothetical protein